VFQGTTEAWGASQAMAMACKYAKCRIIRHRRIRIWRPSGVPARELAERAGCARLSMSLHVYSHVMPVGRDRVRAVPLPARGQEGGDR
jgi:hypothetical protein